jgi:hypothetical protein
VHSRVNVFSNQGGGISLPSIPSIRKLLSPAASSGMDIMTTPSERHPSVS